MCLYFLEKIWFHQKPARLRKPVCIAQSYRKDAFLKICKIKPVSELLAQPSALQLQTALPMCPTHSQGQQPEKGWEITTHWHSYSPMVQENKLSTITSGSLFKTRVFKTWFKPRMWYSSHCWWFNSSSSWISQGEFVPYMASPLHCWPWTWLQSTGGTGAVCVWCSGWDQHQEMAQVTPGWLHCSSSSVALLPLPDELWPLWLCAFARQCHIHSGVCTAGAFTYTGRTPCPHTFVQHTDIHFTAEKTRVKTWPVKGRTARADQSWL